MFLKDLDYLLASWHTHGYEPLTADAVLAMPSSTAMQRYIDLHETAITSDEPFVQIAIEYEIESMATSLGPRMVRQCLNVLGPESVQGLSFVEEHVKLDIGHTVFTQRQLSDFLEAHPRAVVPLARAGSTALNAYVDFLGDCLDVASINNRLQATANSLRSSLASASGSS